MHDIKHNKDAFIYLKHMKFIMRGLEYIIQYIIWPQYSHNHGHYAFVAPKHTLFHVNHFSTPYDIRTLQNKVNMWDDINIEIQYKF